MYATPVRSVFALTMYLFLWREEVEEMFKQNDKDLNGKLSWEEFSGQDKPVVTVTFLAKQFICLRTMKVENMERHVHKFFS